MKTYLMMTFCLTLALLSVIPASAAKPQLMPTLAAGVKPPRVFLESASRGNQWSALRNQSIEMSKDFGAECPVIQITTNPLMADYTVKLNHLEVGFTRNNQMQIIAKNGDQLSVSEGGSIRSKVKQACILVLTNWNALNQ